jgi:hypothetical protein
MRYVEALCGGVVQSYSYSYVTRIMFKATRHIFATMSISQSSNVLVLHPSSIPRFEQDVMPLASKNIFTKPAVSIVLISNLANPTPVNETVVENILAIVDTEPVFQIPVLPLILPRSALNNVAPENIADIVVVFAVFHKPTPVPRKFFALENMCPMFVVLAVSHLDKSPEFDAAGKTDKTRGCE